jgi:hypothetical protein
MENKKRVATEKSPAKVISLAEHREKRLNEGPCSGFCLTCKRINECDEFLEQLEEEWSEELKEISREEGDKTYTVSMPADDGERFIGVLEETLLFQFVSHNTKKNKMYVSTEKETVSRLMVAELMDMEIAFSFFSKERRQTG